MVGTSVPRIVVVARSTEYAALLARHGTREQARFFLETRERSIDEVEARDASQSSALTAVAGAIPVEWRRARVERSDLDRFLFEPRDIVVTVGPSGLVANVAKYLDGQPVVGINPDPVRDGALLAKHSPADARRAASRRGVGSDPDRRADDGRGSARRWPTGPRTQRGVPGPPVTPVGALSHPLPGR